MPANFSIATARTFSGDNSKPTDSAIRGHAIRKLRRLKPGVRANCKTLDALQTGGDTTMKTKNTTILRNRGVEGPSASKHLN